MKNPTIENLILFFEDRLSSDEIHFLVEMGMVRSHRLKGEYGFFQKSVFDKELDLMDRYDFFGENEHLENLAEQLSPERDRKSDGFLYPYKIEKEKIRIENSSATAFRKLNDGTFINPDDIELFQTYSSLKSEYGEVLPIEEYLLNPSIMADSRISLWLLINDFYADFRVFIDKHPAYTGKDSEHWVQLIRFLNSINDEQLFRLIGEDFDWWIKLDIDDLPFRRLKEKIRSMSSNEGRIETALDLLSLDFPEVLLFRDYLEVSFSSETEITGIFPSGRIIMNEKWLSVSDINTVCIFLHHKILHLEAGTHHIIKDRKDAVLINFVHDLIIAEFLNLFYDFQIFLNRELVKTDIEYIKDCIDWKNFNIRDSCSKAVSLLKNTNLDPGVFSSQGNTLYNVLKSKFPNSETKGYNLSVLDEKLEIKLFGADAASKIHSEIRKMGDLTGRIRNFLEKKRMILFQSLFQPNP